MLVAVLILMEKKKLIGTSYGANQDAGWGSTSWGAGCSAAGHGLMVGMLLMGLFVAVLVIVLVG